MNLKFYNYLRENKSTKLIHLLRAPLLQNSVILIRLEEYLKGGADNDTNNSRRLWAHSQTSSKKIKIYLYGILEDAWRYSHDRRPGRRKNLNNDETHINRGVELLLRNRRQNQNHQKLFR